MTTTHPVLRVGDTKNVEAIRRVQQLMQAQGHWSLPIGDRFTDELEDEVAYFQQTHQGPNGRALGVDGVVG